VTILRRLLELSPLFGCFLLVACSSPSNSDGSRGGLGSNTGGSKATGGSDGAGGGSAAGGAGTSSGGSSGGDPDTVVGTFQVKMTPMTDVAAAAASVVGKVYDGPTPTTVILENPQVDGDCTLRTPRVPFCSTPCGGSSACVEDDTCKAYPTAKSVGAVTVSGVRSTAGATMFTMTPIANTYQPPASVTLAVPPFAEGDAVSFSAAGDFFPAFKLEAKAVAPLVLTSTSITLKSGSPMNLTWTKGANADAKIHVKLDISHHGGTKGEIGCDTGDTGSLTVSAALVKKLLDLGIAGYPTVIVTRHTIGSARVPAGRVDLEIASIVEQAIAIEGLTSCSDDKDCASGKTCQSDLTCK
jgi:hypothetical protein